MGILHFHSRRLTVGSARVSRCFAARTQIRCLSLAYSLYEPPSKSGPRPKDEPILVLHGLFGSKRNNRSISKVLARDLNRDVYAIDLRNHGDSPHAEPHTYDVMADDVEDFIQDHGLDKVVLLGHSMGAKVAMTIALRSPRLAAALIPVDNSPVDAVLQSDFPKYIQGLRLIESKGVTKQSEADEILKDYAESLPVRQFLLTNLHRPAGSETFKLMIPLGILGPALSSMGDFPFKDPDQARYVGPTLFVRGTQSPYVADDVLPLVGRFFPNFELADIDSGHWVIAEKPDEFRKAVVEFLKSKD